MAETGNGKTFVAEAVTKKALANGENVAYLVPSVALVGEKHASVSAWTDEHFSVNKARGYKEADVIVATFESFFEAVIRGYADRFDVVILDDFHEIYSSTRGPNIEKGISAALDSDKEVLGMSATIGNPHTIARWLDAELTISSEERAVPIEEIPVGKTGEDYAAQLTRLIRENFDRGPFLVFNDTKPNAEARARGVSEKVSFDLGEDIDFRKKVDGAIKTELTDKHKELISLLNNGIAYHHSGLEQGLKDLIVDYTENGVIKCVFCTTTLSYGFDSPVQSVVVADLKRWGGFREFIGAYEYVQWIGRAGRDPDVYDKAYAFPLYDDEDAFDKFQFDTRVEDKDIEDVRSHLSGQSALRWLVLELVNYGWETDGEVLDFVRSTLHWSEAVDQVPDHVKRDVSVQPGEQIRLEIEKTLSWLTSHGLLNKPIGQPQGEATRYHSTDLGSAFVDYEHSNWFDNSVESVLELTEWLDAQADELTPELLVQRIATEYYQCGSGGFIEEDDPLSKLLAMDNLNRSEGLTAGLVCWYWCSGVPLTQIVDLFGDEVSGLANTASNISTALESVQLLYEPFEMPAEPEWLKVFAEQVEAGVPGPDMYIIQNTEYFGRKLYHNLREQLDRTGGAASDWDLGEDNYVIERLSKLLADSGDRQFLDVVKEATGIGNTIGQNVLETVLAWDPDSDDRVEVPYSRAMGKSPEAEDLTRYHDLVDDTDTDLTGGEGASTTSGQSTKLSDF